MQKQTEIYYILHIITYFIHHKVNINHQIKTITELNRKIIAAQRFVKPECCNNVMAWFQIFRDLNLLKRIKFPR